MCSRSVHSADSQEAKASVPRELSLRIRLGDPDSRVELSPAGRAWVFVSLCHQMPG